MPREINSFQIQVVDTKSYSEPCVKCRTEISPLDDPEHVIVWPAGNTDAWHFHIVCYGDVVAGMVEFFKVFIIEKSKTRILQ